MPRPPTLTAPNATQPPTAQATQPAKAQPAEAQAAEPQPAEVEPAEAQIEGAAVSSAPDEATDAEQARANQEAAMIETHRTRLDALGLNRDESSTGEPDPGTAVETSENGSQPAAADAATATATATTATATPETHSADPLRARLAELDAEIGPHENSGAATATAQGPGGEVATAIVVQGLGSFGAITSFKQALERVDGVHGISLALGPTGEFVYRASHDAGFDLVAAIEQIEQGGAQIDRQADGSLRVSVQRSR
jgi:hypothetical protein